MLQVDKTVNDLEKFYFSDNHRLMKKYVHYLGIYNSRFSRFRGQPVNILEMGVNRGGSLEMWQDYFGKDAKVFGVDRDAAVEGFNVLIGDISDRGFLRKVRTSLPALDIIIDDCSHISSHQRIAFEELFIYLNEGGLYCVEDVYTNYQTAYGGGYKESASFMEFTKRLVDVMNLGFEIPDEEIKEYFYFIKSVSYYSGMIILEKGKTGARGPVLTGKI